MQAMLAWASSFPLPSVLSPLPFPDSRPSPPLLTSSCRRHRSPVTSHPLPHGGPQHHPHASASHVVSHSIYRKVASNQVSGIGVDP